jgi:hypothetical protein
MNSLPLVSGPSRIAAATLTQPNVVPTSRAELNSANMGCIGKSVRPSGLDEGLQVRPHSNRVAYRRDGQAAFAETWTAVAEVKTALRPLRMSSLYSIT